MIQSIELGQWAFAVILAVFAGSVMLVSMSTSYFLYRALLQSHAENRRLTERLVTFSTNTMAASSAIDSLRSKDPLPDPIPSMRHDAAWNDLVQG